MAKLEIRILPLEKKKEKNCEPFFAFFPLSFSQDFFMEKFKISILLLEKKKLEKSRETNFAFFLYHFDEIFSSQKFEFYFWGKN